jgi:hypothetical protein
MAGENQGGGLPNFKLGLDPNKYPLYDIDDERMKELNDAQLAAVDALRKRYEQPNWFKVAAGFAKPQLGGFTASLGSAAEALGETEELRRAAELPIAQMRLELMQQGAILGSHKTVNDEIRAYRQTHKTPPPLDKIMDWEARSPGNPVVAALHKELTGRQLQQQTELTRLTEIGKRRDLTPAEMARLTQLGGDEEPTAKPPAVNVPPADMAPRSDAGNEPRVNTAPNTIDNFVSKSDGNKQDVVDNGILSTVPLQVTDETNNTSQSRPIDETLSEKQGTLHRLENGARVNQDVYKLAKLGVPITSNIRTPDEQEAQKDHRDPNNPTKWLTKAGRPVGEDSKHFRGDAIDIDPRTFTDEHKRILEENGWYQPEWAKKTDTIHYERKPGAKPEVKLAENTAPAQPQKVEEKVELYTPVVRMPDVSTYSEKKAAAIMDAYKARAAKAEAPFEAKMITWDDIMHGSEYTSTHNRFDRAIDMMEKNPDMARKVFAIISNSGEWLAALNKGFSGNVAGASAGLSFPADAFIKAGLPESAKVYADEIGGHLLSIAFDNLKVSGVPLKGAQNEAMKQLQTSAHMDLQADAAYKALLKDRAIFDHNREIYDQVKKEYGKYHDVNNSITPYADIWANSKALRDLEKKYQGILRAYNEFRLPPPKGNKP